IPGGRRLQIDAFGPGVSGTPVRLLKLEALVYRAEMDAQQVFEKVVAPQFHALGAQAGKLPGMPALQHPSSISREDRRRYSRIVDPPANLLPQAEGRKKTNRITESAWQCKIPRVLTEVTDHLQHSEAY